MMTALLWIDYGSPIMDQGPTMLLARPRWMMLNWMMVKGYRKLKEETQQREEWRRQTFEPA